MLVQFFLPDSSHPSEKRDFTKSGPIQVKFTPSIGRQDREISIPIINDNINEAEEGFFVMIMTASTSVGPEDLIRGGVTLVRIRDDDRK